MAFHSYTHLIGKLFNAYPCGPPYRVTGTSPWTCVDHSVSRLPPMTHSPLAWKRPLQTRFRCGSVPPWYLASPGTATRRFIMQKARRHGTDAAPTACRRTVSGSLSLFCAKCFSPFPHGTGTLSVSHEYLALPDGPGGFTQDYSCPALLRVPLRSPPSSDTGLSPAMARLSSTLLLKEASRSRGPTTPGRPEPARVWAAPRSLATTGGIIDLFSSPAGTKMFQFPAFAS